MAWEEEAPLTTTWAEPTLGAFPRNAFQADAFQVSASIGWQEPAEETNSWTEESEV